MKHLTIDTFLERIAEMPDIEAEEQLVLRKDASALEQSMLQQELARIEARTGMRRTRDALAIGHEIQVLAADNIRLNGALKTVRLRMQRLHWSEAVRAVFGQDGYEQCRVWMAANQGQRP